MQMHCKSYSHFFRQKNANVFAIFQYGNFKVKSFTTSLSFEQLGPGCLKQFYSSFSANAVPNIKTVYTGCGVCSLANYSVAYEETQSN